MATSKTVTCNSSYYDFYLGMTISQNSYDSVTNTSSIHYKCWIHQERTSSEQSCIASVVINGSVFTPTCACQADVYYTDIVFLESDITVTHGSDKTITIPFSCSTPFVVADYSPGSMSVSGELYLDPIAPTITLSIIETYATGVAIGIKADADCTFGKYTKVLKGQSYTLPDNDFYVNLTKDVIGSINLSGLDESVEYDFYIKVKKDSNDSWSEVGKITFKTDVDQLICALIQNGVATKYKIYDHDGSKIKQAYLVSNGQGVEIGSVKS